MAHLYADENFPLRVVLELRALGHDVLTTFEAGQANQKVPDKDVLRFASEQGRAVLTLNRLDFFRLHREDPAHKDIIACTRNDDSAAQAAKIHAALKGIPALDGEVVRINRGDRQHSFKQKHARRRAMPSLGSEHAPPVCLARPACLVSSRQCLCRALAIKRVSPRRGRRRCLAGAACSG